MNRLALLAVLLLVPFARGEVNVVDSLEWMAARADVIVVGTITVPLETARSGDLKLAVTRVLKGKPAKTLAVRGWLHWPLGKTRPSGRVLIFARNGKAWGYGFAAAPADGEKPFALAAPTAAMRTIDDRDDVISHVASIVAAQAKNGVPTKVTKLDAPMDKSVFRRWWGGSAVYIKVPIDAALERNARRWIAKGSTELAIVGVGALAHFPGEKTVALLKALQTAPTKHGQTMTQWVKTPGGTVAVTRDRLRLAAYLTLRKLGVDAKDTSILSRKPGK